MKSLNELMKKYPEVKALYGKYSQMKARCYNPNVHNFSYYGGKGVEVCDEWLNCFEDFAIWCLENGYKKGMAISRFNDTGNYSPDNCKILTMSENTKDMIKNNNINRTVILSNDKNLYVFESIQKAAKWLISEDIPKSKNNLTVASFLSNTVAGYNNGKSAYGFNVKFI
jgi:hypothetical protein